MDLVVDLLSRFSNWWTVKCSWNYVVNLAHKAKMLVTDNAINIFLPFQNEYRLKKLYLEKYDIALLLN